MINLQCCVSHKEDDDGGGGGGGGGLTEKLCSALWIVQAFVELLPDSWFGKHPVKRHARNHYILKSIQFFLSTVVRL